MSQTCPTVNIKIAPSEDNPGGIVTINESDFDSATMTLATLGEPQAPIAPEAPEAPIKAPWA